MSSRNPAQSAATGDRELTIQVGELTRKHAVIDDTALVPAYGPDQRMHIRQEDLDDYSDEALGELVLSGAQMRLAEQLR